MMNKFILLSLFLLAAFQVSAQKQLTEDAIKTDLLKPYDNFFTADREMVYTQFNKSQYLTGDDIWFTSWVLNPASKLLSIPTSKLYVELWSSDKKMISRKILYVKGGTASNFMHLADTLTPGTYCFRSYTNWMRNFYEDKDYNVPITIRAPTVKKIKTDNSVALNKEIILKGTLKTDVVPDYDIQFLPESGHFLEGIDNAFGVKVTDAYGHGVKVTGKVFGADNDEIATYTTNQMGMSYFIITETPKEAYHSQLVLPDGSTRDVKLPQTEEKGVAIYVNPYLKDVVWVRLLVSPAARESNQSYFLMIHANGTTYANYKINFNSSPSVQFKINKATLGNGVIYATLFNSELQPISERVFYNQTGNPKGNLALTTTPLSNDTIQLNITSSDSLLKAQIARLSFSILPTGTQMNKFTTGLLAESRLRPALKGDIENPDYYFEQDNTEHLLALDYLMLTQGWRKYDWQDITKKAPLQFLYPQESAFSIKGSIKNWLKNKSELKSQITLFSPQNKLVVVSPVDDDGKFNFNNLYLADSSCVIASASSVKGANWNRVLDASIPEISLGSPDFAQVTNPPVKQEIKEEDIPNLTKGVIRLGEVLVTANRKDPFTNDIYVSMMSRKLELTMENYMFYSSLEQLLLSYFNVTVTQDSTGYHFDMGRGTTDAHKYFKDFDPDALKSSPESFLPRTNNPIMTIDGRKVWDPMELFSYPLVLIEAVAVDKSGTTGGMYGDGGVIAITTRTTPLGPEFDDGMNLKRLMVKGYSAPKEYFEPKYLIRPDDPDFTKYATVYWKPEVVTDIRGKASFRFVVPKALKSIYIKAEGISTEGLIFRHEENLRLVGREENDN